MTYYCFRNNKGALFVNDATIANRKHASFAAEGSGYAYTEVATLEEAQQWIGIPLERLTRVSNKQDALRSVEAENKAISQGITTNWNQLFN